VEQVSRAQVLFERVPSPIINLPEELFRAIDVESADVLVLRDTEDMSCCSFACTLWKMGIFAAIVSQFAFYECIFIFVPADCSHVQKACYALIGLFCMKGEFNGKYQLELRKGELNGKYQLELRKK